MTLAIAVGLAGAVGALARYLVDGAVQDRSTGPFPFGTLVVNVVGSLILGFLAGYVLSHVGGRTAKTIIGTGFCGALTTWSTASWEGVRLAEEGAASTAVTFTLVNLVASFAAAAVGIVLLAS
ncbi:MAG: fluoride efflux transporter CrcB [Acidimicrobiia bacterium]|nr:fluoride efflux transporter CrcB [Acidimicrobiia bacterium]